MRVLVTGGAGFIGSNLVIALAEHGHDVSVVDDLSIGRAENVDARATLTRMDILDPAYPAYVRDFRPEAVVHLAAQSSVTASIADPERDRRINVEGTRAVALAARQAGARVMLSASSAAVYGNPAELPLTEESPTSPINPYGASKLEAESVLAEALEGSGCGYASMRFSNVYGPRQDAAGEGGVVAQFMSAVCLGRTPVIFGDGEQTRDFIYVGDLVDALVAAMEPGRPLSEGRGVFNISTGRAVSVNELLAAVAEAAGEQVAAEHSEERAGDIRDSVLDASRAGRVLGWRATTGLPEGIVRTWEWWAGR